MTLLDQIKTRAPEYDAKYYDFILKFTLEQGAKMGTASEQEKWELGKYFSTRYEMYMYAVLLGLKKDYSLPIERGTEKMKFIAMDEWGGKDSSKNRHHQEITEYIIMSVLAKGDYDFFTIEEMEENEIRNTLTQIKSDIESYANGGFDIIHSKAQENEAYFIENENSFIDLLDK
ncbi:MAG: hypothetical protein RLN90_00600 [Balneolaceae bacterium]